MKFTPLWEQARNLLCSETLGTIVGWKTICSGMVRAKTREGDGALLQGVGIASQKRIAGHHSETFGKGTDMGIIWILGIVALSGDVSSGMVISKGVTYR